MNDKNEKKKRLSSCMNGNFVHFPSIPTYKGDMNEHLCVNSGWCMGIMFSMYVGYSKFNRLDMVRELLAYLRLSYVRV